MSLTQANDCSIVALSKIFTAEGIHFDYNNANQEITKLMLAMKQDPTRDHVDVQLIGLFLSQIGYSVYCEIYETGKGNVSSMILGVGYVCRNSYMLLSSNATNGYGHYIAVERNQGRSIANIMNLLQTVGSFDLEMQDPQSVLDTFGIQPALLSSFSRDIVHYDIKTDDITKESANKMYYNARNLFNYYGFGVKKFNSFISSLSAQIDQKFIDSEKQKAKIVIDGLRNFAVTDGKTVSGSSISGSRASSFIKPNFSLPNTPAKSVPTPMPTFAKSVPSTAKSVPTPMPTSMPTIVPTSMPTIVPTSMPTIVPTPMPTFAKSVKSSKKVSSQKYTPVFSLGNHVM